MLTGDPEALSQPSGRLGSPLTAPVFPQPGPPSVHRAHDRTDAPLRNHPGSLVSNRRTGAFPTASAHAQACKPRPRPLQLRPPPASGPTRGAWGTAAPVLGRPSGPRLTLTVSGRFPGGGAPPRRRQEAVSERQASSCRCEGGRTGGDASRGKAAGVPHPARRQAVPRLGRGSLLCLRPWGGLSALRRSKLASPTAEPQGPVRAPGGLAAAASSSAGPAPRRRGRPLPCLAWRVPLHSSDHVDMPVLSAGTRGGQRGRKHTEGPLGASQSRRGTPQGVLPETSARFP